MDNTKQFDVVGHFHPEEAFKTISEWKAIAHEFLKLQKLGYDVRGGIIDENTNLIKLIEDNFGYQYNIETVLYPMITQKYILGFIENFVNYRVWGLKREFQDLVPDVDKIKIAFFHARGDLEPFMLMDSEFTKNVYGNTKLIVETKHWTSKNGFLNLKKNIKNGNQIAISTFTVQVKEFFRADSNYLLTIKGYLVAAFKSDAYTIVTDNGNRAVNMFRMPHPTGSNLYFDVSDLQDNATSLWNEIVVNPIEIISGKIVYKY